jgi:hypothetical protein
MIKLDYDQTSHSSAIDEGLPMHSPTFQSSRMYQWSGVPDSPSCTYDEARYAVEDDMDYRSIKECYSSLASGIALRRSSDKINHDKQLETSSKIPLTSHSDPLMEIPNSATSDGFAQGNDMAILAESMERLSMELDDWTRSVRMESQGMPPSLLHGPPAPQGAKSIARSMFEETPRKDVKSSLSKTELQTSMKLQDHLEAAEELMNEVESHDSTYFKDEMIDLRLKVMYFERSGTFSPHVDLVNQVRIDDLGYRLHSPIIR